MSGRFAIFLFAFWLPLMQIGGVAVGELYRDEFNALSGPAQIAIIYLWFMVGCSPILIATYIRKSK